MRFFLLLALAVLGLAACRRVATSSQIQYVGQDAPGTVKVQVNGVGGTQLEIENDAQTRVFEQLLYVGLPAADNSNYRLPLAANRATTENLPFLKKFFGEREYRNYVSGLERKSGRRLRTSDRKNTLEYVVTVNYDSFRRYMEQNQVVRKFGY